MQDGNGSLSVAVAVLTFRRNEALAALLPQLAVQASSVPESVRIIVVDNDPGGSAQVVVSDFVSDQVSYVWERTPGIAAARNTALEAAVDADLLAFIDDDEVPSQYWLRNLLAVFAQYQSTGVVGNVLRDFEIEPDPWIRAGGFFDRDPISTGTRVPAAGTGNLLLDLREVRRMGLAFDEEFSLSGGSDTLFTRGIVKHGGELVWCADAEVREMVPASRITRKWVLTRAFRIANGDSRTAVFLGDDRLDRAKARANATGRGLVRMAGGSYRYLKGKLTGRLDVEVRGLRTTVRGAGLLSGAYGYHYTKEYKKVRSQPLG